MKLKIGSRDSALAVKQAQLVMEYLAQKGIETELVTMKTTGDIILDKTLDKIGGKGLFVKELDAALLSGEVDLTVHSFKDMPTELDERLPIAAVSKREDPRDVLILPKGVTEFCGEKPIGCSSARRTVQLAGLYPGIEVAPLRGNVITRLEKLDEGGYSAIVLAFAGLKRLGLSERASRVLEPGEMLPASCQGILAVQSRGDFDRGILSGFNDSKAFDESVAERAFTETLDGGCSSPVAAHAFASCVSLTLIGMYCDEKGGLHKGVMEGLRTNAEELGHRLAVHLKGERT